MDKVNDVIRYPEYWESKFQVLLYNAVEDYMVKNNLNRTELAKEFGVTKGYISQILNGNYNHSISKFIDIVLKVDLVPDLKLVPIEQYENRLRLVGKSKVSVKSNLSLFETFMKVMGSESKFQFETKSTKLRTDSISVYGEQRSDEKKYFSERMYSMNS